MRLHETPDRLRSLSWFCLHRSSWSKTTTTSGRSLHKTKLELAGPWATRTVLCFCVSCRRATYGAGPTRRLSCVRVPRHRHVRLSISRKCYSQSDKGKGNDNIEIAGGIGRVGKAFRRRLGNTCAGQFVSRPQTPGSLSSGRRNLRLCRKWICDAATCVAAEVQRDYLTFDSTTDSSPRRSKSRSRKSCCIIRSPLREFVKKTFASFSTRRRTPSRCNFLLLEATRPQMRKGVWLQDRHLGPRRALLHGR